MKKSVKKNDNFSIQEYTATFAEIKKQIKEAQVKAVLSVNKELLVLYWFIGKTVVEREQKDGWGAQVIERLAQDLQREFPGVKGFSRSNVFSMRAFYSAYWSIVQEAPGQLQNLPFFAIPWWHNVILLAKVKDNHERLWYAQKSLEYGWSGSMLESWIKSDLYRREGKAITNFSKALPASHSDMAQQSFKDPYIFDFLTLHNEHVERDLEQGLMDNIQRLLLEMGKGFAFVGR
jgi:predicted nuclease of restriction endonuclease-like (RecB) superfamily